MVDTVGYNWRKNPFPLYACATTSVLAFVIPTCVRHITHICFMSCIPIASRVCVNLVVCDLGRQSVCVCVRRCQMGGTNGVIMSAHALAFVCVCDRTEMNRDLRERSAGQWRIIGPARFVRGACVVCDHPEGNTRTID